MSSGSEFSIGSDLDVAEGSVAAAVMPSVQESYSRADSHISKGEDSGNESPREDLRQEDTDENIENPEDSEEIEGSSLKTESELPSHEVIPEISQEASQSLSYQPDESSVPLGSEEPPEDSAQSVNSEEEGEGTTTFPGVPEEASDEESEEASEAPVEDTVEDSEDLGSDQPYVMTQSEYYTQPPQKGSVLDFLFEKPKLKHNPGLPNRVYKYRDDVKAKVNKLAHVLEEKAMEECTFHPQILGPSGAREYNDFWLDQVELERRRLNRLEEAREESTQQYLSQHCSFAPELCQYSVYMAAGNRKHSSVFEKLFKQPLTERSVSIADESLNRFRPTINHKSSKIKRDVPVSEHLYNDALRRRTSRPEPVYDFPKPKMISRNSEKCLMNKFIIEFHAIFDEYEVPRRNIICYSLYLILLYRMHFIRNDVQSPTFQEERFLANTAWNSLFTNNYLYVSREALLEFLLSIMNFRHTDEGKAVQHQYWLFYENRDSYLKDAANRRRFRGCYDFSFRPHLSKYTRKLAQAKLDGRGDFYDFLVGERHQLQEKWKKSRMERDKQELRELPFRPTTNTKKFSKVNKHKPDSMAYAWKNIRNKAKTSSHRTLNLFHLSLAFDKHARGAEELDDFGECTFNPDIDKQKYKQNHLEEVQGHFEVINRLKKAREDREQLREFQERGYTCSLVERFSDLDRKSRFLSTFRSGSRRGSRKSKRDTGNSSFGFGHSRSDEEFHTPEDSDHGEFLDESVEWPICVQVTLPSGVVESMIIENEEDKMLVTDQFIVEHALKGETAKFLREQVLQL